MSLDFARTYSQLISLSPDAPANAFYSTDEYYKLLTLGPSLPNYSYPLPTSKNEEATESTTCVKLKSIKPPFKFTTDLKNVSTSLSIYKLKCQLIEAELVLSLAGAGPTNLKFMVKSKILTDTTTVGLLGDDISITVMVSQPVVEKASVPDVAEQVMTPVAEVPKSISNQTWSDIESLLESELGAEAAKSTISKWKAISTQIV